MPGLLPGATCDICLEMYDKDKRAPCSIRCGHVCCSHCFQQIAAAAQSSQKMCPFCRMQFRPGGIVRLQIDVQDEPTPSESSTDTPSPVVPAGIMEQIQHLQDIFNLLGQAQTTSPVEFKRQLRVYLTELWSLLHCEVDDPAVFTPFWRQYDLLQRLAVVSQQLQDSRVGYLLRTLSNGNNNLVEGWIQCLENGMRTQVPTSQTSQPVRLNGAQSTRARSHPSGDASRSIDIVIGRLYEDLTKSHSLEVNQ